MFFSTLAKVIGAAYLTAMIGTPAGAETSFRGLYVGITVPEASQKAKDIGFRATLETTEGLPVLRLYRNTRLCAQLDIEADDQTVKLLEGVRNESTISPEAIQKVDLRNTKIKRINAFDCYFDAASVDTMNFVDQFTTNYIALKPIEFMDINSSELRGFKIGYTVLRGGEYVEFRIFPSALGGFMILIQKASTEQTDSASQVNPKF